jgi:DNA-binding NarL/FixJ family response regulator
MGNPPTSPGAIRVYILDNQPIFRDALARFFEDDQDIQVVGLAGTRTDVYPALVEAQPHVILYDPSPAPSAHELAGRVVHLRQACPTASIIVLMVAHDVGSDEVALRAGADAFVSKERAIEELRNAIVVAAVNKADGATRPRPAAL